MSYTNEQIDKLSELMDNPEFSKNLGQHMKSTDDLKSYFAENSFEIDDETAQAALDKFNEGQTKDELDENMLDNVSGGWSFKGFFTGLVGGACMGALGGNVAGAIVGGVIGAVVGGKIG